jgi:hypothetical protein
MAQIDTSGIENFDSMSDAEKVSALLSFQYDDGAEKLKTAEETNARLKAAMDKATSEAAGFKKQLKEKMTAEELKQQESDTAIKEMQDKLAESEKRLAEFEQREKISTAKAAFLGGGFDEATAADAANAFITGDIEKMSAAVKKFRESIEVSTKSKLMGSNPKPESGAKADDDNGKCASIAEQLGKARAEQAKKAQSILDQYTRR